ncbi:MAG TPA: hypothetical protein VFX22_01320, partial [Candidatus Kapabacteria bacterium]|nr:hypothetical protein [Candidatus Kapabacteria bacterium]
VSATSQNWRFFYTKLKTHPLCRVGFCKDRLLYPHAGRCIQQQQQHKANVEQTRILKSIRAVKNSVKLLSFFFLIATR